MSDKIKLDEISLDAAVKTFANAFTATNSAMASFAKGADASPYTEGSSAAASPLSSYMKGLAVDYLGPTKESLSNLLSAIPNAAKLIQDQDASLASGMKGGV